MFLSLKPAISENWSAHNWWNLLLFTVSVKHHNLSCQNACDKTSQKGTQMQLFINFSTVKSLLRSMKLECSSIYKGNSQVTKWYTYLIVYMTSSWSLMLWHPKRFFWGVCRWCSHFGKGVEEDLITLRWNKFGSVVRKNSSRHKPAINWKLLEL